MVEAARTAARRTRSTIVPALVVVSAGLIGVLVYRSPASSSSTSASPIDLRSEHRGALGEADGVVPGGPMVLRPDHRGALGEADGVLPDGATVFDDEYPGIANLDPDLLGALRQAATGAADDGVEVFVVSGWRSAEYQEQLFRQAVSEYGSGEKAAHWVATPRTSAHEWGNAVDIGHSDAKAWLSEHGAEFGLCQVYASEPWHFELRPEAIDHSCPAMYADPTHEP